MYEELVKALRNVSEYDSGYAKMMYDAADAIEELSKRVPPVPHGRLIDADALKADLKRQCNEIFKIDAVSPDDFWITRNQAYNESLWTTWCESLFDYLKAVPTIIPADGKDIKVPTREEDE